MGAVGDGYGVAVSRIGIKAGGDGEAGIERGGGVGTTLGSVVGLVVGVGVFFTLGFVIGSAVGGGICATISSVIGGGSGAGDAVACWRIWEILIKSVVNGYR